MVGCKTDNRIRDITLQRIPSRNGLCNPVTDKGEIYNVWNFIQIAQKIMSHKGFVFDLKIYLQQQ